MSRVAFLSGLAQGIGRALAERLLADGWAVGGIEIDDEAAAAFEHDHPGAPLLVARGDVASASDVRAAVAATVERFGGLDGLVHVAGIGAWTPLEDLDEEAWSRVLDVNLGGAYRLARAAAPALTARRGAIVLIASTRAFQSEPDGEAYAASKGGLVSLAHALAASLGPAVRANAVAPGGSRSVPGPSHPPVTRSATARSTASSTPSDGSAGRRTSRRWSPSCSTASAAASSPARPGRWTAA